MLNAATKNLSVDIQASIAVAHRSKPDVFKVIENLGLRNHTIALCLGLAPSTVSMWAIGRDAIPPARFRQLITLCREAYDEALNVIASAATRQNKTPVQTVAVNAYADRVARAGQLLQQLDG